MKQKAKNNKFSETNDEDLFLLVQQDDSRDAFAAIYERYSKKVFGYCLKVMGDEDEAKDIFQNVISKIYEKRSSFAGGSFIAWLMIITRNECLMAKRMRKNNVEIDKVNEAVFSHTEFKDFAFNDALRKTIDNLPEDIRETVVLRYFNDLSYEEIAEAMNVSLSLVKVRLHRSKALLAKSLAPFKEYYK